MEYLRAVIRSEKDGPLYKKDFEVQKVFDMFVRRQVSKMINMGEVLEREFYSTVIVPRYEPYEYAKHKEKVAPTHQRVPGHAWLSLEVPDPPLPAHMQFFTLEIHLEERPYVLSENFTLDEIGYFWQSIERTLVQFKIMNYQDERQHLLFACKDDQFDFDREVLYTWQKEADELIEIVVGDETQPDTTDVFPHKELKDFSILGAKKLQRGKLVEDKLDLPEPRKDPLPFPIHILIGSSALEGLQQAARSNTEVEIGGWLVGDVYEDGDTTGYHVKIVGHIPAQDTVANEVELRTTFESWQQQSAILKERYPGKRIVGWYHTHLDLVSRPKIDRTLSVLYTSPIFFSQDDDFTHRQFFRQKWYVAMVLDTRGNLIFYRWAGHKIIPMQKFYVTALETALEKKEEEQ